jgi:hypothetical protein
MSYGNRESVPLHGLHLLDAVRSIWWYDPRNISPWHILSDARLIPMSLSLTHPSCPQNPHSHRHRPGHCHFPLPSLSSSHTQTQTPEPRLLASHSPPSTFSICPLTSPPLFSNSSTNNPPSPFSPPTHTTPHYQLNYSNSNMPPAFAFSSPL